MKPVTPIPPILRRALISRPGLQPMVASPPPGLADPTPSSGGGIITKMVRVSPELAQRWLEQNTNNRAISDAVVKRYAEAMTRGEWKINHQGIAFNAGAPPVLYDGQHRLWAVVYSGVTIECMVTWGLPEEARADIDGGRRRSVADNLGILGANGIQGAPITIVACANIIQALISGEASFKATYHQTLQICDQFRAGVEWAVALPGSRDKLGSAPIRGGLAFAYGAAPGKVQEFADRLYSGANLQPGDPILLLRNLVLAGRSRSNTSGTDRREMAVKVLRAAHTHCNGGTLKILYANEESVGFFADLQGIRLPRKAKG